MYGRRHGGVSCTDEKDGFPTGTGARLYAYAHDREHRAWATGYHPYTLEPVYSAKSPREKLAQRMFFFWYKPEEQQKIKAELRRIGRTDLADKLFDRTRPMEWNKKGNAHYDLEGRRHRPEDRSGHSRRTFSKGENREQASADRACSKSAERERFLQNPRREAGDGRNRAMRRRNSGKS